LNRTEDWFGNSVHKLDSYAYKNTRNRRLAQRKAPILHSSAVFTQQAEVQLFAWTAAHSLMVSRFFRKAARVSANGGTVVSCK
jgi:hypothetical protein